MKLIFLWSDRDLETVRERKYLERVALFILKDEPISVRHRQVKKLFNPDYTDFVQLVAFPAGHTGKTQIIMEVLA